MLCGWSSLLGDRGEGCVSGEHSVGDSAESRRADDDGGVRLLTAFDEAFEGRVGDLVVAHG